MRYAFFVALFSLLTHGLWAEAPEKATAGPKSGPGGVLRSDRAYIPTLDVVREACAKEHPKKCLKRRCASGSLSSGTCDINWKIRKNQAARLKGIFGSDWEKVQDSVRAVWETLLHSLETSKTHVFENFFAYPVVFRVKHDSSRTLWEEWLLESKEDLRRVFPYIRNRVKSFLPVPGPACCANIFYAEGGYLHIFSGKMCFEIKKLTTGSNKGRYQLIFNKIIIESDAFLKDVKKIRYELGRYGRRIPTGLYPQPGSWPPRPTSTLRK